MPSVNAPINERLPQMIAEMHNQIRAMATQQQSTITNAQGEPVMTTGLVPGSDPAEYGLQFLDPSTGLQTAFFGEDSTGAAVLNVTGTETVTGTLDVTGNAIIGGTLSLPNGIINNAALASPVTANASFADTNSTNLTVAGIYFATASVTVPTGFTSALVTCYANVGDSRTSGAGPASFVMAAWIGDPTVATATGSATISATCADGGGASTMAVWTRYLTGLTAGTAIQAGAWGEVLSTAGWVSGAANGHTVIQVIFLR